MISKYLVSAALLAVSLTAFADCPPGQMPGHDRNGNRACISVLTNQVVALEPVQDPHCSPGYDRVLDPQGRFMCIDKQTRVIANPKRANCPPGTWLKEDAFGYERCAPVP